jgi:transposase
MSPRFVRPYVKLNKNDARDAEAICEAVTRPSMRFVVVKSHAEQDLLALHRVRALLIRERTALMNQMRGLLAKSGIVIAQGSTTLRRTVAELQDNSENGPTPILREILVEMSERLRLFEERLKGYDTRITGLVRDDQQVARLMAVEGGRLDNRCGSGRDGGRRSPVPYRTRVKCVVGTNATATLQRRAQVLLGISKRGDCFADSIDPRRSFSSVLRCASPEPTKQMAGRREEKTWKQYRRSSPG